MNIICLKKVKKFIHSNVKILSKFEIYFPPHKASQSV
jgi:hypothetical protein